MSSSPSPHRLPTVSAAQALQGRRSAPRVVATGLPRLDAALASPSRPGSALARPGGVVRGQLTEAYGPPGVGKSALALQLAAAALAAGLRVVWIDAAHALPGPRLQRVVARSLAGGGGGPASAALVAERLKNLVHFSAPTLPHLVALLHRPPPSFPPPGTALLVVDSLSVLIDATYARAGPPPPRVPRPAARYDPQQWAAARKWSTMQLLVASMQKLAGLHDLAVVLLNQAATRMQPGLSASLVPAVSSTAWDAGIAARIVLFRDWGWDGQRQVRFARVLKADGVAAAEDADPVPFVVEPDGIREVPSPRTSAAAAVAPPLPPPSRKRKRETVEVPDSEDSHEDDSAAADDDDDYGWTEGDIPEEPTSPPPESGG